jgi:ABC-type glutathione transport system ATPase component
MKIKRANYLSASQSLNSARHNRKMMRQFEKRNNHKNVPESEYLAVMKNPGNVVEFDDLHTYFFTDAGTVKAVDGVSFDVPLGKTVGVVGESGCGKSVTSLSLMQILQRPIGKSSAVRSVSTRQQGHRHRQDAQREDAESPGKQHLDDLPGADDQPQPGL